MVLVLWGGGGIGRRRTLKMFCPYGRVGSSPTRLTHTKAAAHLACGFGLYQRIKSAAPLKNSSVIPLNNAGLSHCTMWAALITTP